MADITPGPYKLPADVTDPLEALSMARARAEYHQQEHPRLAFTEHITDWIDRAYELLGPDYHVFESNDDGGWSLQHPLACRPALLDCPVQGLCHELTEPPVPPGRYRCEILIEGELTFEALDG